MNRYGCACVRVLVSASTHVCACACTHVCVCASAHVYVYVFTRVCMYVNVLVACVRDSIKGVLTFLGDLLCESRDVHP